MTILDHSRCGTWAFAWISVVREVARPALLPTNIGCEALLDVSFEFDHLFICFLPLGWYFRLLEKQLLLVRWGEARWHDVMVLLDGLEKVACNGWLVGDSALAGDFCSSGRNHTFKEVHHCQSRTWSIFCKHNPFRPRPANLLFVIP